jgi:hypothetical protein
LWNMPCSEEPASPAAPASAAPAEPAFAAPAAPASPASPACAAEPPAELVLSALPHATAHSNAAPSPNKNVERIPIAFMVVATRFTLCALEINSSARHRNTKSRSRHCRTPPGSESIRMIDFDHL